jgi:hypothetical protein
MYWATNKVIQRPIRTETGTNGSHHQKPPLRITANSVASEPSVTKAIPRSTEHDDTLRDIERLIEIVCHEQNREPDYRWTFSWFPVFCL